MAPAAAALVFAASVRRLRAVGDGRRSPLDRLAMGALGRVGRSASAPLPGDGSYRIDLVATSDSGVVASATLVAAGDPGYGSTGSIIAEAALALARDTGRPRAFGVTTPALALGAGFPGEHPAAGLDLDISVGG